MNKRCSESETWKEGRTKGLGVKRRKGGKEVGRSKEAGDEYFTMVIKISFAVEVPFTESAFELHTLYVYDIGPGSS